MCVELNLVQKGCIWQISFTNEIGISLMLATPTKIMNFQSPICQKLARVVEQSGSMFYSTRTSICTKKFILIGHILSEL